MPSKTDINPATGKAYAVNPYTGVWDDNYWATVVEPYFKQLCGLNSSPPPSTPPPPPPSSPPPGLTPPPFVAPPGNGKCMPSKTDINPATGKAYAVNPYTGVWDDNYWATVVEPYFKQLCGLNSPPPTTPPPPPPVATPTPPSNLNATAISSSTVRLTWTDQSGGQAQFSVWRFTNDWVMVGNVGTATSFTESGLTPNTIYYYKVKATNSAGSSETNIVQILTPQPSVQLPSPPANLNATAISSSAVRLTWTDQSGGQATFSVWRFISGIWTSIANVGTATTYTDNGLSPTTTYYYKVQATNSAGTSETGWITVTTPQPAVQLPSPPSNLSATAISSSAIRLTWTDQSGGQAQFSVWRFIGGAWSSLADVGTATTYTDNGLSPNTIYYYKVKATNSAGSSETGWITVATPQQPVSLPTPPSNLTATAISSSAIRISWVDQSGGQAQFSVWRLLTSTSDTKVADVGTATSYTEYGLVPSTTYYYKVKATNSAGTSETWWASAATLNPGGASPNPPTGGRCSAVTGTVSQRVAVFWRCVNALDASDHLVAEDLGQWARNLAELDAAACISVGDFRRASATMQGAIDNASVGIAALPPKGADVEGRISAFWTRVDQLGPLDYLAATDLGQWGLNVIDRDPSRRIRVLDFRTSTAAIQAALDRARAAGAGCH